MKLYVGNLSFSTTSEALQELFSQAGSVVSATVLSDKFTGRSKGFGFVEFGSDEEGNKAISMFDGKDVDGRNIKVNEARPMEPRPAGGRGGYGGGRGGDRGDRGGYGGGNGGGYGGGRGNW